MMNLCEVCGAVLGDGADDGSICGRCLVRAGFLEEDPGSLDRDEFQPAAHAGDFFGKWRVEKKIGEGAFGEVYRVARDEDDLAGALKILRPGQQSRQVLARFDAEIRGLRRLSHPGIAAIYDWGKTEKDLPWFVMEYIEGDPVSEFSRRGKLPIVARLELFLQICGAVGHAHERGIVHRDLKPSNILVSRSIGGETLVKVIDFGVAKALDVPLSESPTFTYAGTLVGTPEYMSPEQAGGHSLTLDERSDVYSLGVILYELLVETTPVTSADLREVAYEEMVRLIRSHAPQRPSRVEIEGNEKVSPDIDRIALKALEKDRARRYADSNELGADVARCIEGQTPLAPRGGRIDRWRDALLEQTNSRGTTSKRMVGFLLLAMAGIWGWGWSKRDTPRELTAPVPVYLPKEPPRMLPGQMPDLEEPGLMINESLFPDLADSVARICQRLRNDPSDRNALLKLCVLLAKEDFPELLGNGSLLNNEGYFVQGDWLESLRLAFAVSDRGVIRGLSMETGEEVFSRSFGDRLTALSASEASGLVAVGGDSGKVHLLDFSRESAMPESMAIEAGDPVRALAFDLTGEHLYAGLDNGTVTAFGVSNTGVVREWESDGEGAVSLLRVHPSGRKLGLVREDGGVDLIESLEGRRILHVPTEGRIAGFGFSSRWSEAILGREGGDIEIWDIERGEPRHRIQTASPRLESYRFRSAAESKYFMAGGKDGRFSIHPVVHEESPNRPVAHGQTADAVTSLDVRYAPGRGLFGVTGHAGGRWQLWNLNFARSVYHPVVAGPRVVRAILLSEKADRVFTVTPQAARIWNTGTRKPEIRWRAEEAGFVTEAAFLPDGKRVRFLGKSGAMTHRLEDARVAGTSLPIPNGASVVKLSQDGGQVIAAAYGSEIHLWDCELDRRGNEIGKIVLESPVVAMALSPKGDFLAAWDTGNKIKVWETRSGAKQFEVVAEGSGTGGVLVLSSNWLGGGGTGGKVWLYDWRDPNTSPAAPALHGSYDHSIQSIAISPDQSRLAIGDQRGHLRLFDTETREAVGPAYRHRQGHSSLRFVAGGAWLVSATFDAQILYFDSGTGEFLCRERRWVAPIAFAAIDPGQTRLVTSSLSGNGPVFTEFPPLDESAPDLLIDFAETLFRRHYREGDQVSLHSPDQLSLVRQRIEALPEGKNRWNSWLKWLAAERGEFSIADYYR